MNQTISPYEIAFSHDFMVNVSTLERVLRGKGEPVEIIEAMLLAVLHFYQADSVTLVETNMHCLSQWSIMRVNSKDKIPEQSSRRLPDISEKDTPNLYRSLINNDTLQIDVAKSLLTPVELEMLRTNETVYAIIAPFQKRKSGYLVLRNPHQWADHNEFVQIASYVIVSELNEVNLINELDLANAKETPMTEFDVHVQAFGSLNITTSHGTLSDVKVNKLSIRLIIYLVLNRYRLIPQDELFHALWGNDFESGNSNNLRQLIARARKEISPIYPNDFIISDGDNRYRLSPDLKIHLDTDAFEAYFSKARNADFADTKIAYFLKAIDLYKGHLLAANTKDEWIERTRTFYQMELVNLILDALPLLYEREDYENLYSVSSRGIDISPDHPSFHYYYLLALYHKGFYDLARKHYFSHYELLYPQDSAAIRFLLEIQ